MTGYRRPFVDTAPFIYYLEKRPQFYEEARSFFSKCINGNMRTVSSAVTVEEYLVHPYREGRRDVIDNFYGFIRAVNIEIVEIDREIADRAAEIRARYPGFKGMGALQLACAALSGCDVILTNDRQLMQFAEVPCVMLADLGRSTEAD